MDPDQRMDYLDQQLRILKVREKEAKDAKAF